MDGRALSNIPSMLDYFTNHRFCISRNYRTNKMITSVWDGLRFRNLHEVSMSVDMSVATVIDCFIVHIMLLNRISPNNTLLSIVLKHDSIDEPIYIPFRPYVSDIMCELYKFLTPVKFQLDLTMPFYLSINMFVPN